MTVICVVRKDLKMRRGKEIVQVAHGIEELIEVTRLGGTRKICLQVDSEKALKNFHRKAQRVTVSVLVCDAGKTEFHGRPTVTVAVCGPIQDRKAAELTAGMTLY